MDSQCSHLLDVGEPVVVGERGAVHLYPQVARGLVRQQLARVPEVGLDIVDIVDSVDIVGSVDIVDIPRYLGT